jgi:hypothetical protein
MIRKFITPTKSDFNLVLEFPGDYLGQELELIIFKKQEGLVAEKNQILLNYLINIKGYFPKKMLKVLITIAKKCAKNGTIFNR